MGEWVGGAAFKAGLIRTQDACRMSNVTRTLVSRAVIVNPPVERRCSPVAE